jgi:signal transduction histidine kinase
VSQPDDCSERDAELKGLREERAHLLDELEMAYLQLESALAGADRERRITYEQLAQRNAELRQRLVELREAQHMLVRSERLSAMGEMAATIVHEINNPLAIIVGKLEIELLDQEEGPRRESLEETLTAVWHLRDLTQDVLNFSRRSQTEAQPVDLNQIICQVRDFFQPLMKDVEIETQLAEGLPQVAASASQLEQVLTNFLVNSLDAMKGLPHGQIRLTTGFAVLEELIVAEGVAGRQTQLALDALPEARARSWIFAEVEDNGGGIGPEVLGSIFTAFFTTKGEEKGTGLGLAISRRIAEAHGGNILVASGVGEESGTNCRLLLPPTRN